MSLHLIFVLENYTKSATADRMKIDNTPDAVSIRNLLNLHEVLSRIAWDITEIQFNVSSAYRCELLNKAVGGAKNSAHLKGLAADLITYRPNDLKKLYRDIKNSSLNYDQLILYNTHLHISIDERLRKMAFAKIQHVSEDEAKDLHGY